MKEKLVKPRILVCTPSNAAVNAVVDIPGLLEESFSSGTIAGLVGCVVAVVCNRIYYNKRASLFVN